MASRNPRTRVKPTPTPHSEETLETTSAFPFTFTYAPHTGDPGEPRGQIIFTLYEPPLYTVEVRSRAHPGAAHMPLVETYEFRDLLGTLWWHNYTLWRNALHIEHEARLKQLQDAMKKETDT